MIEIIGNYVYKYIEFYGWIRAGKIEKGFDGYYIQWFA
jgi:hypothetical protein